MNKVCNGNTLHWHSINENSVTWLNLDVRSIRKFAFLVKLSPNNNLTFEDGTGILVLS